MIRAFLSFDKFLFPRIVRWVYFIGLILIAISLIVSIVSGGVLIGTATNDVTASLFMMAGAVIGAIISCIVWRLVIELWMVAFSINDNLRAIRDGLQKKG